MQIEFFLSSHIQQLPSLGKNGREKKKEKKREDEGLDWFELPFSLASCADSCKSSRF
jgi:hypothetical protein